VTTGNDLSRDLTQHDVDTEHPDGRGYRPDVHRDSSSRPAWLERQIDSRGLSSFSVRQIRSLILTIHFF
jgi:hypothetical protein